MKKKSTKTKNKGKMVETIKILFQVCECLKHCRCNASLASIDLRTPLLGVLFIEILGAGAAAYLLLHPLR